MLRFAVFDEKGPAREWPLVEAHLLGPEDLAVSGKVTSEPGFIVCKRTSGHTVALCLQFETGSMGRLMLHTCLLPHRDEPYILTVELARHRIKTFIAKSEEWQILDLTPEHPSIRRWEEARSLFTQAITSDDPRKADEIARVALVKAIDATERLAMAHADILLHRRFGSRAASPTVLGVRAWPGRSNKPLQDLLEREFDVVQVPMPWRQLEVEEGRYRWEAVDQWIDWGRSVGKPLVAGPLLDFSKRAVPDWMHVWQHDYDTCRDLAYDHVEKLVKRYGTGVGLWNLAAGLNLNDNFNFSPDQMIDLVRMASLIVKQSSRRARTMIEIVQPFGESSATCPDALSSMVFLDRIVQAGIRLDAIGVQLLFGTVHPGQAARDLMQISNLLDRFFFLEIPVVITAAGVPSEPTDAAGGTWHDPWSLERQAKWASRLFAVAMSKPHVESFFWVDLFDHPDEMVPNAGLITDQGRAKPVMQKLLSFRKRLKKPLGPVAIEQYFSAPAAK